MALFRPLEHQDCTWPFQVLGNLGSWVFGQLGEVHAYRLYRVQGLGFLQLVDDAAKHRLDKVRSAE